MQAKFGDSERYVSETEEDPIRGQKWYFYFRPWLDACVA
jgi:hypothetical protein